MMALLPIVLGLVAGALLGLIYFFGLWMTLKQLPQQKNPGLLMLFSLFLRLGLVLCGFYLLMRVAGWQGLLAALLSFTLVRLFLSRRLGPLPHIQGKVTDSDVRKVP